MIGSSAQVYQFLQMTSSAAAVCQHHAQDQREQTVPAKNTCLNRSNLIHILEICVMVGSINLSQQMLQLQYTNKELFSPSYHQTADGTKPLQCTQPSCRASRILLCQIDALQEMRNGVSSEMHHAYRKRYHCFNMWRTDQYSTRHVKPYHRSRGTLLNFWKFCIPVVMPTKTINQSKVLSFPLLKEQRFSQDNSSAGKAF
jgi:hypothetical protein